MATAAIGREQCDLISGNQEPFLDLALPPHALGQVVEFERSFLGARTTHGQPAARGLFLTLEPNRIRAPREEQARRGVSRHARPFPSQLARLRTW
jgi:hypothetical protein